MGAKNGRTKKIALITGPTSGIGLELAKLFAADGFDLVLVAHDKKRLLQTAKMLETEFGTHIKTICADLSEDDSAVKIFNNVRKNKIELDALVNNAGFTLFGEFAQTDWKTEIKMIHTNIVALTALTKFFLPEMVARKKGKILNLASTAAFQPGPLMSVYYATKSYVLSFSESIANELKGTGVSVTALCPGPTQTNFEKRGKMEKSMILQNLHVMDAREVAKAGYAAMMRGDTFYIPGFVNALGAFFVRFVPRNVATEIIARLQKEKK